MLVCGGGGQRYIISAYMSRGLFTQGRRHVNPFLKNGVILIVVMISDRKNLFHIFTQVFKVKEHHGNDIEFLNNSIFSLRNLKMKNVAYD